MIPKVPVEQPKDPKAVARGKASIQKLSYLERQNLASSGGKAGGPARAQKLTPEQRQAIAKKAAAARWSQKSK